ncbi:MAG: hypothetical protein KBA31_11245 [Alphaproteobacteria bacterium]|nr:hypothetical protein [Alphaproteobacteria bacterium]
MEKQFIDFVGHVFTLDWALWALPLSLLCSLLVSRVVPGFVIAAIAVAVHHVGLIYAASGKVPSMDQVLTMAQKLEPLSVAAEFAAYSFLIIVFSLTRQDMFRPSVLE